MKLVLFDIDGTLLLTDGAGRRAIHRALAQVVGSAGPADHEFGGKTDPQIVRELMRLAGHGDERVDGAMITVLEAYVAFLHEELADRRYRAYAMPGIPELLDAIEARPDATLGLLTGNVEAGACAKLAAAGIDRHRFAVGAFGSDHETRAELPAIARRRFHERSGRSLNGRDIIIIGDTPSDIQCGRSLDVHSIGVATGSYSVADLADHAPTSVFRDLSDTQAVIHEIFGDVVCQPDPR